MTVVTKNAPYGPKEEMSRVEELAPSFYRITGSFGFMQHPDITILLKR